MKGIQIMKKSKFWIILYAVFTIFTVYADDNSVMAGFWFNSPKSVKSSNVEGVAFGLPVYDGNDVEGAALSIFGSRLDETEGLQGTLLGFTKTKRLSGLQISFANFVDSSAEDTGVQLGFFNQSRRGGFQVGFINQCKDNATIQIGLVNINKNGFFPVMIFVNFDKDLFD